MDAVINSPMRVFLSVGEAGTGKSTNAKIIAQLLGLPYYAFTCSEGTDEVDLVSSMVPNTGERPGKIQIPMPTYQDLIMDRLPLWRRYADCTTTKSVKKRRLEKS